MMSLETTGLRSRDIAGIWLIAAAVAIPLLIWMLAAMRSLDVPPSEAFFNYNSERVEQFREATDNGAIGVVVMGDSRVRYGTELQDDLSARLTDQVGHEVAVLRLTNDWATYEDFDPLMPLILEANPQLVLLQEELRLKNRGYDASEAIKREYLWYKLLGEGVWDPGKNDQVYYQEEMTCEAVGDEDLDNRVVRLARWVDYDQTGEGAQLVSSLAETLEAADITLRYLDVPISADAAAILPGVDRTEGPLGLSPSITLSDENYCDNVHMDPVARAAYTDWFIDAIGDELIDLQDRS